jgi:hypothetical protein
MLDGSVTVADSPEKSFDEPPVWELSPVEIGYEREKDGSEIRFRVKVKNIGDAPTPTNATVTVEILMDGDFRIGRIFATVPPLAPGGELWLAANAPVYDASGTGCKTTWTAVPGWRTIMALLNAGNCYGYVGNTYRTRCCREMMF